MANSLIKSIKAIKHPNFLTALSARRHFGSVASVEPRQPEAPSSSFTFSPEGGGGEKNDEDSINLKAPNPNRRLDSTSVTMPMSFMTGSIVGKRFYKHVSTREAEDGNGWMVMLDYRTLKTPSKRPLKLPTLFLAKAIAAEWEYQVRSCFCYFSSRFYLFLS